MSLFSFSLIVGPICITKTKRYSCEGVCVKEVDEGSVLRPAKVTEDTGNGAMMVDGGVG